MKKKNGTDKDNGIAFNKKYHRVRDHNVCNVRYKTSKEIPVVLHDSSK